MTEDVLPLEQQPEIRELIARALAEDMGPGDATTLALVAADAAARARIVARHELVVAGAGVAAEVFRHGRPGLRVEILAAEGESVAAGATVLRVAGPARALLTAERTALNLLQRMTGIATATECLVRIVTDYGTLILDTRKTVPGLRRLDKYAVKCGGGTNHRIGLHDAILIKDNHLAFWRQQQPGTLADAVQCARQAYPGLKIEIEVDTLEQLQEALAGQARLGAAGQHEPGDGGRGGAAVRGALQDRGLRGHHQGERARIRPGGRHRDFHRRFDAFPAGGGPGAGF
jgi:nicotinate-nucleotide pyrophosphorylase (carboxylating)